MSNSTAMNLFLVNWDEFTSPRYPPGLPRVSLFGDRKNVNPSPYEEGFTLSIEKANRDENEAVVLDSGSNKAMGLLKMTVPELDDGTSSSLVRPTTPFRRYESPRSVRFRRVKDGKSRFTFS